MRFFGQSEAHSRTMDFKTWSTSLISYMQNGTGSWTPRQMSTHYAPLSNHTTFLPASSTGGAVDQLDGALTYRPFASSAEEWNLGTQDFIWSMDNVDATSGGTSTIHQVWVRPATNLYEQTLEAAIRSAGLDPNVTSEETLYRVASNFTGVMRNTSLEARMFEANWTNVATSANATAEACHSLPVPFEFNLFGANYGNGSNGGVYVCDNALITFGDTSVMTDFSGLSPMGFNGSLPPVGFLFGASDRLLLDFSYVSGNDTKGLSYVTAFVRYSATNLLQYDAVIEAEVTLAVDSNFTYIELRMSHDTNYLDNTGVWGLSDGFELKELAPMSPGASVVGQGDATGRFWGAYPNHHVAVRLEQTVTPDGEWIQ